MKLPKKLKCVDNSLLTDVPKKQTNYYETDESSGEESEEERETTVEASASDKSVKMETDEPIEPNAQEIPSSVETQIVKHQGRDFIRLLLLVI